VVWTGGLVADANVAGKRGVPVKYDPDKGQQEEGRYKSKSIVRW